MAEPKKKQKTDTGSSKKSDWKGKDANALKTALAEKREALREFRWSISGSKVRNIKEAHNIRKEIARILTEQKAQEIASAKLNTTGKK